MVTSIKPLKQRFEDIDLLKGLAIILMSFVHVNSLLFVEPFGILDDLTFIGSTVCFVAFLFSFSFLQGKKLLAGKTDSWRRIFKKIFQLYICYLLLGALSILLHNEGITLSQIIEIGLLKSLPLYVEFLIAFVWLTIFIKIFGKAIIKLFKYPYILFIFSLVIYALGVFLYNIELHGALLIWFKMHLVGNLDTHIFPLFQYMPVYVLGILMAKYGSQKKYLGFSILFVCILIILTVFNLSVWYRWPPSILYLIEGMLFVFIFLYIFGCLKSVKILNFLKVFGADSLLSLVIVTALAFLSAWVLSATGNPYVMLSLNAGVLILSYCVLRILKRLNI